MGSVHGDGGDHKALGRSPFRSLLERDMRTLLGANPAIDHYAIEPHELTYHVPDGCGGTEKHVYVPDVVCRYRGGEIVVIDAKALYIAGRPGWTKREPFIREAYLLDHGVPFAVIGEDELRVEPRLSNCQVMERHRYIATDHAALRRVRDVLLTAVLPMPVAGIAAAACLESQPGSCRAFTALMNLALAGEVYLDLGNPITPSSHVYEAPAR